MSQETDETLDVIENVLREYGTCVSRGLDALVDIAACDDSDKHRVLMIVAAKTSADMRTEAKLLTQFADVLDNMWSYHE